MRWLRDHNENERRSLDAQALKLEQEKGLLVSGTVDWIETQTQEIAITQKLRLLKLQQEKIKDYDKKIEKMYSKRKDKQSKQKYIAKTVEKEELDKTPGENDNHEDDILLEEVAFGCEDQSSDEDESEEKYQPVKVCKSAIFLSLSNIKFLFIWVK